MHPTVSTGIQGGMASPMLSAPEDLGLLDGGLIQSIPAAATFPGLLIQNWGYDMICLANILKAKVAMA